MPHDGGMKLALSCLLLILAGTIAASACSGLNRGQPTATAPIVRSTVGEGSALRTLRVVTYNVHMESTASIATAVENNPKLAAADVLLLQEIEHHRDEGASRAEQVAERLGMNAAYAPGYGLPGGGSHGVAILSRVSLRDVEILELPYFNVVVNSARRVALAATIELDGQDVRIFSVHLDNRINPSKRRRQLGPVLQSAKNFSGSVVIAGDLNTSPFCWAVGLLPIPCGMQDNAVERAARASGMQTPLVGVGSTSKWLGMRLDAIYTRGFGASASAVERTVTLSDHLPVWVDLQLI
tara:strand:- start:95511 stop:96398 length:888 start_codon:yes stop_codon:yes gene_type:complete